MSNNAPGDFNPVLSPEEAKDADALRRWIREGKAHGYDVILLHPDGTYEFRKTGWRSGKLLPTDTDEDTQ
jgi:hypothetical protein